MEINLTNIKNHIDSTLKGRIINYYVATDNTLVVKVIESNEIFETLSFNLLIKLDKFAVSIKVDRLLNNVSQTHFQKFFNLSSFNLLKINLIVDIIYNLNAYASMLGLLDNNDMLLKYLRNYKINNIFNENI